MGPRFLIDTNVVIDHLDGLLPLPSATWYRNAGNAGQFAMSVITRIELLSKPLVEVVLQRVMATISTMDVLPLDEPAILETIRLRQLHKKKLPDAIIAATALVHGLTIVTRNVADFANIAGLRVLNPHDPTTLPPL